MKTKVFFFFLLVAVSPSVCFADETNIHPKLQFPVSSWTIPETWQPNGFFQTVANDAEIRFGSLFVDSINQRRIENPFSNDFRSSAQDNLGRAVAHSARSFAGYMLPWDFGSSRSSGVIAGSIANPEQDIINPASITPYSYGQSWWKKVNDEPGWLFGVRPFNENPYAYLAKSFRHEGATFLSLNARYYYYEFRSHRVELVALVPLGSDSLNASFGVSYVSKGLQDNEGIVGMIELQKVLQKGYSQTSIFVGMHFGAQTEGDRQQFVGGLSHKF